MLLTGIFITGFPGCHAVGSSHAVHDMQGVLAANPHVRRGARFVTSQNRPRQFHVVGDGFPRQAPVVVQAAPVLAERLSSPNVSPK